MPEKKLTIFLRLFIFILVFTIMAPPAAEAQVMGSHEIKVGSSGDNVVDLHFSAADMDLFARIVHAEAEGEPFIGQVAVAASILNRIGSELYPDTLHGVVYQVEYGTYQYSPVRDGRIYYPAGENAIQAVQEALNGYDPSNGAIGFYNPQKTNNRWVRTRPVTAIIGGHIFFR